MRSIPVRIRTPRSLLANQLKRNIAANFAGSLWQALMGLAFIPIYIRFLGVESFGLLGFFVTLQTMFGLLDFGLSATLTRETARLSVTQGKEQEMRDLVRSLEAIYWGVAVLIAIIVGGAAPLIANHWIKAGSIPLGVVKQTIFIMGIVIALQWPSSLYAGGIVGLQRQVVLNGINIAVSTIRNAGAVLILWLVAPTITAYLVWQGVTTAAGTILLAVCLWRMAPSASGRAMFRATLLHGVWRFAAGMSGISILAVVLTQVDKIVLSRTLSLVAFGYYTLASMAALSLTRVFTPVFYSIYPRFTQLVSAHDSASLTKLYHKCSQFMAVLVLPPAIVAALFSYEILLLWTHNAAVAVSSHRIVTILICGTAINGLMNPPYALQLAFGWTRLSIIKNAAAVVALVPLTVYLSARYGGIGAASAWLMLNIGYLLIEIPVMHRRLLPDDKWKWYREDLLKPAVAGVGVALSGRLMWRAPASSLYLVAELGIVSMLTFLAVLAASPEMLAQLRASRAFAAPAM